MKQTTSIPTVFAVAIAESVGLMEKWDALKSTSKHHKQESRLIAFQQMAIGCDFEDAVIAYHGEELSEDQIAGLAIIYKSTVPWLIGHVVGKLMDEVSDGKGKSAELILTELLKDGKVNPEVAKELIVRLQVVKPGKKPEEKKDE